MIPAEAVEAAARAHYESSPAHRAGWVQISAGYKKELMEPIRSALEAAAPYMLANLTAESPRLPTAVRNKLFEMLGDFMEKFELESRMKGPSRHVATPGYEWGDMCGDFERRVVTALRAAK